MRRLAPKQPLPPVSSFANNGGTNFTTPQMLNSQIKPHTTVLPSAVGASNNGFRFLDSSSNTFEQTSNQLPPGPSTYTSAFPESSLDISLPGDTTLGELLKPTFPTGSNSDIPTVALGTPSLNISSARPLSPTTPGNLDISAFGDPSLSGLLSTDATVVSAQANKSFTPWMMQEVMIFFSLIFHVIIN